MPGYTGDQFRSFLDLRNPRAWYDTGSGNILGSMVTSAGSDQVTFTSMGYELADANLGCADGQAGTYTWAAQSGWDLPDAHAGRRGPVRSARRGLARYLDPLSECHRPHGE